MRFIRAEFKKVFVTTLRLMTDPCQSKNKYMKKIEPELKK